jgi:hypothetical protein
MQHSVGCKSFYLGSIKNIFLWKANQHGQLPQNKNFLWNFPIRFYKVKSTNKILSLLDWASIFSFSLVMTLKSVEETKTFHMYEVFWVKFWSTIYLTIS